MLWYGHLENGQTSLDVLNWRYPVSECIHRWAQISDHLTLDEAPIQLSSPRLGIGLVFSFLRHWLCLALGRMSLIIMHLMWRLIIMEWFNKGEEKKRFRNGKNYRCILWFRMQYFHSHTTSCPLPSCTFPRYLVETKGHIVPAKGLVNHDQLLPTR
jgi:hypothetical protein